MSAKEDKYPTRVDGVGQIMPRETPVTVDGADGPLSSDQVKQFDSDGYLFFKDFYSQDIVNLLRSECEELRYSEEIRQSEVGITEPSSGSIRSIFAVHTVSDLFSKLASDRRIVDMITQLLGTDLYLHQTRLNLKPGFRGKEFYWHSDFETWHAEDGMPDMRSISCSIALTDNHDYNGPLMVIPGSHHYFCQCSGLTPDNHYQQSLKKQDYGVPSDDQLTWLTNRGGIEMPKGPAGTVLLFDSNLMHGSNGNITPFPRTNAFFVYNSMDNQLTQPYAAEHERPWYLANREPEALESVDFATESASMASAQ